MEAVKILGAQGDRRDKDFYPTPPECTESLLQFLESKKLLRKKDVIWETACVSNAMVDVMRGHGYSVFATDIQGGYDFLNFTLQEDYDWIITNPPFSLAQQFIERSATKGKPFAMLLKSQYWHSAKRQKLFMEHPPLFVLPLTWRPDFLGKGKSLMDVIWCVWVGDSHLTFYHPLEKPTTKARIGE